MTRAQILLGVDGGNTKTVAVATGPDGTVLGTGHARRGSDIHAVPVEDAIATIVGAADEALRAAHEALDAAGARAAGARVAGARVADERSVVAAFSLAGADWPEDVALLESRLRLRWPGATVVNDAIGALRAAVPSGPGIVIACGTGTATGARGPDGRMWSSGFWQGPQGAHELGVRTLQAVYRAELGIDEPTVLTERVLAATGEPDVPSLLHHASGREIHDRRDPAALAALLLDAADDGDPAAEAIVVEHGRDLGRTALAAARQVGIDPITPFALALTGGVMRHPSVRLREAILGTVRDAAPGVVVVATRLEPVAGAVLLAFDAAGLDTGEVVRDRIASGLAGADLFATHHGRHARRDDTPDVTTRDGPQSPSG